MSKKFFRVFRAGKYPQGTITERDVAEIAECYDPKYHEAPLTVNHDDWTPALAFVDEVKAEGKDLLVSFKDIAAEAYEMNKKYKRPSCEIVEYDFGDVTKKYLRAVTLTNFPQVKSMDKIQFGENSVFFFMEDLTLNLSKGKEMFNENLLKLAAKLGIETKDLTTDDELILKCKEAVETLQSTNQTASDSLKKFSDAGVTVEAYQEKLTLYDAENKKVVELEAELKTFKEQRVADLVSFAIKYKETIPAQGDSIKTFAEKDYNAAKKFVDGLKDKPANPKLTKPDVTDEDQKFFKEDGKRVTYEDILREPSLAAKFSEEERAELKKNSETFKS